MFRRVALVGFLALAACSALACINGDNPDSPLGAGAMSPTASCKDSLGSTWSVTPSEVTVTPGTTLAFSVQRNGSLYTPGVGSPVVHYDAPDGGTLADPNAIETTYTAGAAYGDYRVEVTITEADGTPQAGAEVCGQTLVAIVHVTAGIIVDDDAGTGQTTPPPAGATSVDLGGAWSYVMDANTDSPAPVLLFGGASPTSVTVAYDGTDGQACGCNAYHLVVPLGKTFDCSKAKLEFDYEASGSFSYTSNESLSFRFCSGDACQSSTTTSFYSGPEWKGSAQTGHSNCAWEWQNQFPAAPQLAVGHDKVDLSQLQQGTNGSCSGTFDTIDIHVEAYACFKGQDTGQQTLSNLYVY